MPREPKWYSVLVARPSCITESGYRDDTYYTFVLAKSSRAAGRLAVREAEKHDGYDTSEEWRPYTVLLITEGKNPGLQI